MYSIQFVGALSLTVCPGARSVKSSIGRPAPKTPAPDFIVPQPVNTTDELLAAFAAVDFSSAELLASFSAAGADDFYLPLQGMLSLFAKQDYSFVWRDILVILLIHNSPRVLLDDSLLKINK